MVNVMRTMLARFAGVCGCGASISVGDRIGYDGRAHCASCVGVEAARVSKVAADRAAREAGVASGELVIIRWRKHPSQPHCANGRTVPAGRVLAEAARLARSAVRPLVIEVGGWRWTAPGMSARCAAAVGA